MIESERERLAWLTTVAPCPAPILIDGEWLLTTTPDGVAGDQPERQPSPDGVPVALGVALRQLHDLPAETCPFERRWADCLADIEAGDIDLGQLPEPYGRYERSRLLELLRSGRPVDEDLVVVHGRAVVPNLYLNASTPSGYVAVHRLGVGDRHQDLASAHRSLVALFGPEAVIGFYEGYGAEPGLVTLDHYILIDVLLGAIVVGSSI